MALALGYQPQVITVYLSRDSWFAATVVSETEPWPPGVTAELRLSSPSMSAPLVWTAEVDGSDFTWSVSPARVNEAQDAGVKQARLFYLRDGRPELWGKGSVSYA